MFHPNRICFIFKISVFILVALTALALPTAQATEVVLSWERPSDDRVDGYYIYWGPAPDYDFESAPVDINIPEADTTSCTISNLQPNTEYEFAARSYSDTGETSELSQIVSYTTPEETSDGSSGDGSSDGGTDAGDTSDPGDFADSYHAVGFFHNGDFGTENLAYAFDDNGTLTIEVIDQSSTSGTAAAQTDYQVDADGRITMADDKMGVLSANKNFFVAGDMADSASITFGIRQAADMASADFSGQYRIFLIAIPPDMQSTEIGKGVISADGAGSLTVEESTGSIDLACSYSVNSTGELTLTPDETAISTMYGAISADGRIFAAADTESSDGSLVFALGLRIPEGQSDSNLAGEYYVNQFEYTDGGSPAGGLVELHVADDLNYETSEIESTSGFVRETAGGYMVMVDGTGEITAVESDGDEIPGAMASGGDVMALQQDSFIGIGIQQTSGAAQSEDGGGGSGGGCFISSIIY
ncbi:MAG: fibronectin type III domain-containing protein [Desulfobacterales bacterium]|nr:fibronectin type III domain-containing protein [Desulfobacterales bacterium]MBS3756202.1 fibronectin type III domain-containing protein [Desulfobacterales bacterium]